MGENPICVECLRHGVRRLAIFWIRGRWLCGGCYEAA